MRLTKTDPDLGEVAVETTHPAEITQLRAAGFSEHANAAPAEPAHPARAPRAQAIEAPTPATQA